MKTMRYRQCCLERYDHGGVQRLVSWLPEVYAVAGQTVRLRQKDGSWSALWLVRTASPEALDEKLVVHRSRDHMRQRAASDI
jgi:hypothetical protein